MPSRLQAMTTQKAGVTRERLELETYELNQVDLRVIGPCFVGQVS